MIIIKLSSSALIDLIPGPSPREKGEMAAKNFWDYTLI